MCRAEQLNLVIIIILIVIFSYQVYMNYTGLVPVAYHEKVVGELQSDINHLKIQEQQHAVRMRMMYERDRSIYDEMGFSKAPSHTDGVKLD